MYKMYFTHHGRLGRLAFLKLTLISVAVFIVIAIILVILFFGLVLLLPLIDVRLLDHPESQYVLFGLIFLLSLPLYYFNLVIAIRRLHDLNLRGWWLLLLILISATLELIVGSRILTNIFGALQFALFLLVPGTDGSNRFGLGPDVTGSVPPDTGSASSVSTPA